jgi:hypothetical protein
LGAIVEHPLSGATIAENKMIHTKLLFIRKPFNSRKNLWRDCGQCPRRGRTSQEGQSTSSRIVRAFTDDSYRPPLRITSIQGSPHRARCGDGRPRGAVRLRAECGGSHAVQEYVRQIRNWMWKLSSVDLHPPSRLLLHNTLFPPEQPESVMRIIRFLGCSRFLRSNPYVQCMP